MNLAIYLLAFTVPLGVTLAVAYPIRRFCTERGLLDWPGGRKQHTQAVPRLGGVAIFVGFATVVLTGFVLAPWLASIPTVRSTSPEIMEALAEAWSVKGPLFGLLLGGTIIFAVGLADDLLGESFPTALKFGGQSLAAGIAVACGVQVEFGGHPFVNQLLSFLWIVGISNAFNLLDNMDGLSAGVAAVSAGIFLTNAAELGEIFICLILAALLGSLVAFLRFNFHPATLFMGDSGALFIGFTLSSLTILEHYVSSATSSLFPVLMPPLVLAVPLLDTASVIVIRLREGRPVYVGDRCHLSHRLVRCGLSDAHAVLLLLLVTFGLGLGALHLADASASRTFWIVLDTTLMAALVLWGIHLGNKIHAESRHEEAHSRSSGKAAEGV